MRSGWFASHARQAEPLSPAVIAARMLSAGWTRPGARGRVNARDPEDRERQLSWNFLLAPPGWEDAVGADGEVVVTRGDSTPHAHERARVEATTRCNRTTTAPEHHSDDDGYWATFDASEAPDAQEEGGVSGSALRPDLHVLGSPECRLPESRVLSDADVVALADALAPRLAQAMRDTTSGGGGP